MTITIARTSPSESWTGAWAAGLAHVLRAGDVVALRGDLGSGKTTLVRSIAAALGADAGAVSSPTFVIVNQYPLRAAGRADLDRVQIVHVDAYRVCGPDDLEPLGWDRFFDESHAARPGVIALIEWPERLTPWLDRVPGLATLALKATGPTARELTLAAPDAWRSRPGMDRLIELEPARCPVTGRWVAPTCVTFPFADSRARDADLYNWFKGGYRVSRPLSEDDLTEDGPSATG